MHRCDRSEHHVNGRPREADQAGVGKLNPSIADEKMFAGGTNVNRSTSDSFAILGILHALSALAREQAGHLAFVSGVEVLNNHDRGEIGGNVG